MQENCSELATEIKKHQPQGRPGPTAQYPVPDPHPTATATEFQALLFVGEDIKPLMPVILS